jgi:3-oxoadipate enol-lactonase
MPSTPQPPTTYIQPGVLDRPGAAIHYWLTGPERAPLVVLTHGAGADHHMFDAQVPVLAADYRVLTWDVRLHGASRPSAGPFTLTRVLDDLLALLDHVGAGQTPVIAVGQSMGGNVAQELAFHHPRRVRALALIGCACNTWPLSAADRLALRLAPAMLRWWPYDHLVRASAQASALRPEVQAYLRSAFGRLTRAEFSAVTVATMAVLHPERRYRIEQPLLLTHGDADRTGNIRQVAPRWAARDPHCRYEVIPDAGHCAQQDNAEFFNKVLLEFLRSLPPAAQ